MRPRLPQAFSPITARKLDALAASPAHLSQPSSQIVQNRRTRPATSFLTWFSDALPAEWQLPCTSSTRPHFYPRTMNPFVSRDHRRGGRKWREGTARPLAFRSTTLLCCDPSCVNHLSLWRSVVKLWIKDTLLLLARFPLIKSKNSWQQG